MKILLLLFLVFFHFEALARSPRADSSSHSSITFQFEPDLIQPKTLRAKTSIERLNNLQKLNVHLGGQTIAFETDLKFILSAWDTKGPTSAEIAFNHCALPRHNLVLEEGRLSLKSEMPVCTSMAPKGIRQFPAMPGEKYSRLIAVVTAMSNSDLWHEDAKVILAKDFRPNEIKRVIQFAVLGMNGGLKFPVVTKIRVGKEEARVKGKISIDRGRHLTVYSRGFSIADDAKKKTRETFELKCQADGLGEIAASQCAVYAQNKSQPEFSNFIYSGWREEYSEKKIERFSSQLDTNGRSLLMGLASQECRAKSDSREGKGSNEASADLKRINSLFSEALTLEKNVNRVDRMGRTALFYALASGCQDRAEILLNSGARIGLADYNDVPLLHYAILGKSEKFYSRLVVVTPNRFLEKKYRVNWSHSEYRQVYSDLIFNGLLPISSITMAVNEGQGSVLTMLMAKKPKLDEIEEAKLVRLIVNQNNGSVVEAAVKSGLKFSVLRDQQGVFFPANSILAKIKTFPAEERERLINLLEPIAAVSDREALKICESSQEGVEACMVSAGLCGSIKDRIKRDKCYLGKGECKNIQDPIHRGRCNRSVIAGNIGPDGSRDCDKEKMSEQEYGACTLGVGDGKEILEKARRLLSNRRGVDAFIAEIGVRPSLLAGKLNMEEALEFAADCARAPLINSGVPWDGHSSCRLVIEQAFRPGLVRDHFTKKLSKCEVEGSSRECLAPVMHLQNDSPAHLSSFAKILVRLCQQKEPVACMVGLKRQVIPPEDKKLAAFIACEGLLTPSACSQVHLSIMTMNGLDIDSIKKLALKGEPRSVEFALAGFTRINFSKEEMDQLIRSLGDRCEEHLSGCAALSMVLLREGRQQEHSKLSNDLLLRADEECGTRNNCSFFKNFALNEDWRKKLNGFCAEGISSACGGYPGAIANPNEPKVSVAGTLDCLVKNTQQNACLLLITQLAEKLRKEGKTLPDSICNISMSHACTNSMVEERLAELSFNPRRVKTLEKLCNPTKAPGACFWAAKYYSSHQPDKASSLFKKICDISNIERFPACSGQLKLLKAKRNQGELASFVKSVCKDPKSQICTEASIGLVQVAPKTEGKNARESCLAGDSRQCTYYLGYLNQVDSAAAQSLRMEVCAKHKIHCPHN